MNEWSTHSKLANLGVINAQNLLLFGNTKAEDGEEPSEEFHTVKDDAGTAKRVGATSKRIGNLVSQLDPVVVEPASGNLGNAVEMRNVVTASSQHQ